MAQTTWLGGDPVKPELKTTMAFPIADEVATRAANQPVAASSRRPGGMSAAGVFITAEPGLRSPR